MTEEVHWEVLYTTGQVHNVEKLPMRSISWRSGCPRIDKHA